MSGTNPVPAPTFLPPPRTGVQRWNRRVVWVVSGFVLTAVVACVWGYNKRMESLVVQAADEKKKEPKSGNGSDLSSQIKRTPQDGPLVPNNHRSDGNKKPDTPPESSAPKDRNQTDTGQANSETLTQARTQQWLAYWQQLSDQRKKVYEMTEAAYAGSTSNAAPHADTPQTDTGAPPNPAQTNQGDAAAMALAAASAGGGGGSGGVRGGGSDPAGQLEKQQFANQTGNITGFDEDLMAVKHPPKPDTVMAGTVIAGVTVRGSNSDMAGSTSAMVTENICDSMTGDHVLIPQGTKIEGVYDNQVSSGQERVAVGWKRFVFPDTSSLPIGFMEGADQAGMTGEHDKVDTHWLEKFGMASIIAFSGAAVQLAQPQQSAFSGYSPTSVASGQLTQQYSQLGTAYAQAGLNRPNTLVIRPGYRMTVVLNRDIHLPPYVDARGIPVHGCS